MNVGHIQIRALLIYIHTYAHLSVCAQAGFDRHSEESWRSSWWRRNRGDRMVAIAAAMSEQPAAIAASGASGDRSRHVGRIVAIIMVAAKTVVVATGRLRPPIVMVGG